MRTISQLEVNQLNMSAGWPTIHHLSIEMGKPIVQGGGEKGIYYVRSD